MLQTIQHIKGIILLIFISDAFFAHTQFNTDSISRYRYEEDTIKRILCSSDYFLFNIQNPHQKTLISEVPYFLFDFRMKRLENISKLRDKIYQDSLDYTTCDKTGFFVCKCLYDTLNSLKFKYETYNDGTELYDWFDEYSIKTLSIEIHGLNYEENVFIDNKRIKKIIIFDKIGFIQYFDLEGRLILFLEYVNGKIDRGTYINHIDETFSIILW